MARSWTLLRLNPMSQARFMDYAANRCSDIPLYFPVYHRLSRPARKRHVITITKPVYPGYIFAQINPDGEDQHRLTSLPVRARFIKLRLQDEDTTISLIPDSVIAKLQYLETHNQLVLAPPPSPYQPGTTVIVSLPIAEIKAVLIHLTGSRAILNSPLGRITVPITHLTLPPGGADPTTTG
jgi:hypothetical protein